MIKDNTTIHPNCENQAHLIDLHLWRGAPKNQDDTRPIQVLINQGYVVGFCPDRLQPAWSAYRVAHADDDVDFDRPLNYYNDIRLDEEYRIGKKTFGKIGGISLNVGHMAPNEVINRQFGRLAQMETFFMSNMSPQYGSLNGGVWLKLENAIREIKDEPGKKDHVWVIVGPVFSEEPESIYRGRGKNLPVPKAYFCITVDPYKYPYDTLSKANVDCFIIPQNAPRNTSPKDYPSTLEEVEDATKLKFFDSWSRDIPVGLISVEEPHSDSRLMNILNQTKSISKTVKHHKEAKTIDELIHIQKSYAANITASGKTVTIEDRSELKAIQYTISWLLKARNVSNLPVKPLVPDNLITYKVTSDMGDKLKMGVRTACNFWNRFIVPKHWIVIRLGTFTGHGNIIARAYIPYEKEGVRYGRVEFNTKFLIKYSEDEIAGTIIHEIGHILGIGWEDWRALFDQSTGQFKPDAVRRLNGLDNMEVELEGGRGTALAHWDEEKFDKELMTGFKDNGEYVHPVTIDVMEVLGHAVVERLESKTSLNELLESASNVIFSLQDVARSINLDHFEETKLLETIPHL